MKATKKVLTGHKLSIFSITHLCSFLPLISATKIAKTTISFMFTLPQTPKASLAIAEKS